MAITDTRGIIPRDLAAPERQVNSRNAPAPDPLTFMEPRTEAGMRAIRAAVVLVVLPQLSTVRVWYLTFQIPLSMLAAFVSLHCQLSFARTGKAAWAVAAGLAAIASIAAYEIFAPLIAAFPIGLLAV